MKKRIAGLLTGLALTTAALTATTIDDALTPAPADTGWGAPDTTDPADTGWGTPPTDDDPVTANDTGWG
nr:hypothetical protein OH837_48935 [Streptomyces canus]